MLLFYLIEEEINRGQGSLGDKATTAANIHTINELQFVTHDHIMITCDPSLGKLDKYWDWKGAGWHSLTEFQIKNKVKNWWVISGTTTKNVVFFICLSYFLFNIMTSSMFYSRYLKQQHKELLHENKRKYFLCNSGYKSRVQPRQFTWSVSSHVLSKGPLVSLVEVHVLTVTCLRFG